MPIFKAPNGDTFRTGEKEQEDWLEISEQELLDHLQTRIAKASFADMKSASIKKIDADTDDLIRAVIGNRASEYERAEAQAIAYVASGYTGPVPACVQSWADAKVAQGWTPQMAADDILATANAWRPAQEAIRAQRLLRKEQARNAADVAGVDAALAQWAGFLAVIKGQLGV